MAEAAQNDPPVYVACAAPSRTVAASDDKGGTMRFLALLLVIVLPGIVLPLAPVGPRFYTSSLTDQPPTYMRTASPEAEERWRNEVRPRLIRRSRAVAKAALIWGSVLWLLAAGYLALT